jgi:putative phosphonate metabolism protein
MPERFALYYAPPSNDPLWRRAAEWLGRDPADVAANVVADIPGIAAARRLETSASARRYGFHATIKAPMALAAGTGRAELEAELRRFGLARGPVTIGRLQVAWIDGFVALIPEHQSPALTGFAGDVVAHFDRFRAPLTSAERDKRIRGTELSPRQIELLDAYGYPYAMEEFRFHMTLTDRLVDADRNEIMAAAQSWFAPLLEKDYVLDRLALFHEPAPGAPFVRLSDFPLTEKVVVDA